MSKFRVFVFAAALLMTATMLFAGGQAEAAAEVDPVADGSESPLLARRVEEGTLPPLEERMPTVAKVSNEMAEHQLDFEIGRYGGTLRTVTSVPEWDADVFVMNNEPLINTPGILGEEITPNILRDFEVSADQRVFTFYMREGLRWSDGELVTTEDVRFAVEDVLENEQLTPIFPGWLRAGGTSAGEPLQLSIIDDYTFRLTFDEPYGGLLIRMAIQGWRGYTDLLKPAHFLRAYHADYTDVAEMADEIAEQGFSEGEWWNLFHYRDVTNWEMNNREAIDFPRLYPWLLVEDTGEGQRYERNPYYFKVDPEGNQLPYIDRIRSRLVQDIEMSAMTTIAGEVDFSRESAALVNMPLYRENAPARGYRALLAQMHVTPTDIFINQTYTDPTWQSVVQDVRFRQALSLAINRDQIIDAIYYGFAEPGDIVDPTHDPVEAERLLDEMGMEYGPDGFRRAPNGERFEIFFELGAQAPDIVPMGELVSDMWQSVGVRVTMSTIDSTLWGQRNAANELQATMIWTHTPLWYMGDWGQNLWGRAWWAWWIAGGLETPDAESPLVEPPEEIKEIYRLIDRLSVVPPDEARRVYDEIATLIGENYHYIIPLRDVRQPLIVSENLRNVGEDGFAIGWNFSAEQFWFAE